MVPDLGALLSQDSGGRVLREALQNLFIMDIFWGDQSCEQRVHGKGMCINHAFVLHFMML